MALNITNKIQTSNVEISVKQNLSKLATQYSPKFEGNCTGQKLYMKNVFNLLYKCITAFQSYIHTYYSL